MNGQPEGLDDPFYGPDPALPDQLRARACPAGEPHTGDHPERDHGHTDCWLLHRAADRIEELEGGGKPPVRKAIGHEESTYEFVADGNIYRVLRIDPVYGTIVEPSGEDGQAK